MDILIPGLIHCSRVFGSWLRVCAWQLPLWATQFRRETSERSEWRMAAEAETTLTS